MTAAGAIPAELPTGIYRIVRPIPEIEAEVGGVLVVTHRHPTTPTQSMLAPEDPFLNEAPFRSIPWATVDALPRDALREMRPDDADA